MLAHLVFFSLKDSSSEAADKLIASCREHLTGHPGEVFFSVGPLAKEYAREVNDHDFDVMLNVVFDSRESHDAYQVAERHLAFIATNKESWERVRVFDADGVGA